MARGREGVMSKNRLLWSSDGFYGTLILPEYHRNHQRTIKQKFDKGVWGEGMGEGQYVSGKREGGSHVKKQTSMVL